ncbi:hypothetical protein, variant [Aphanomyces invadans]|uniref:Uncharacterized protein n=1 Tax=Aphanomyces invadans TaxID=157072 RepID=A0A024THS9_9STRA|nr:hypothetical protein, variant [Aphanomyces invadans]ETV92882.1 hypothetical protein, variant [Aphanomyces invadans]|eukprot:XP_008878402.1 hypothetical protein, variant [Aphanomyces invadans]
MKVQVFGSAADPEFQKVLGVLEGLAAVHDDVQLSVIEDVSSVRIHVASNSMPPTTVTSVDALLPLLRDHVTFTNSPIPPGIASRDVLPSTNAPLRLFIGGDRSQVGKSTVCLGLLGALLQLGIRQMQQCEEPQLVADFCAYYGIAAQPIGPVVFYSGFTRAFLDQPDPVQASHGLLRDIVRAVDAISTGKRIVLVDGVGYPAVGSICGVSNADVAAALEPISVILVGKKGVGDAVDSFNLNATYFKARHVRVLGGIFNRLPPDGYYSIDQCKAAITRYFSTAESGNDEGRCKAYGFLPELPALAPRTNPAAAAPAAALPWHDLVQAMLRHVDVRALVADAATSMYSRKRPLFPTGIDPIPLDTMTAKKPRRNLTIQWSQPSRAAVQAAAMRSGAPTA